jgi:small subunit ribosomal protein S6
LRHYELVLIFSPTLNQEQTADSWARVKDFIHNQQAEITHEERWGTRRLAYSIHKSGHHFLEGSYHLARFNAEQPFIRELESFLRVDEQILRSLVVATAPPKPVPVSAEPVVAAAAAPPPAMVAAVTEPVAAEASAPAAGLEQGVAAPAVPEIPSPPEEAAEGRVEPPTETVPARAPTRRRRVVEPAAEEAAAPAHESTTAAAPTPPTTRRRQVVTEGSPTPAAESTAEGPTPAQPSA